MSWTLNPLTREHIPAAAALFNQSVADGEMIFSPLDEAVFERRFFQPGAHAFAAEENGELIGFIHGACKTAFLNKENNENTPAICPWWWFGRTSGGRAWVPRWWPRWRTLSAPRASAGPPATTAPPST